MDQPSNDIIVSQAENTHSQTDRNFLDKKQRGHTPPSEHSHDTSGQALVGKRRPSQMQQGENTPSQNAKNLIEKRRQSQAAPAVVENIENAHDQSSRGLIDKRRPSQLNPTSPAAKVDIQINGQPVSNKSAQEKVGSGPNTPNKGLSQIDEVVSGQPNPNKNSKQGSPQNSQVLKSGKSFANVEDALDDSLIDLEYEKNLTKIDYEKLKLHIKSSHATKQNGEFYNCDDVCCKVDTGCHEIISSSEKSDLNKFGIGVMLYFKFVKHLIFYFGMFIIIAIPSIVFYCAAFATYGGNTSNTSTGSLSYLDLLTATTVGSIGLGSTTCGLSKYPDYAKKSDEKTIFFDCYAGTITSLADLKYGLVQTGGTCTFVQDSDVSGDCNNYDATAISTLFANCVGNSSCTVTLDSTIFQSTADCTNKFKTYNIYASLSCQSDSLILFHDQTIDKDTISYVVASLDVAIIGLFLFMIKTLQFAQKDAAGHVLKKAYSASSYTLLMKNLPQDMPSEEVAEKLWNTLNNILIKFDTTGRNRVVDVQIILPNKLIEMNKNLGDVITRKNNKIRQFMEMYAPTHPSHEIDLKGIQNILNKLRSTNLTQYKAAEKLYKKIKEDSVKKVRLIQEIQKLRTSKDVKIVGAFVTFSSIAACEKIHDMYNNSPLERFFRNLFPDCFKKDMRFHGQILHAHEAADPGSILWANLGEPGMSIFLRRGLSLLITILLWVISGGILLVSTYYKNSFKDTYPDINCKGLNPTMDDAAADYNLGQYQQGLIQCFCSADILNRIDLVFPTANNQKLCYNYYRDEIIEKFITFAIIFVVLVINYGLQFVFQGLSSFEKHTTLNNQLAQRVIKTFVAQFLNTGIILIIVNCKFDNVSFWQGKFKDITPLWYKEVGATLLSTMFINVFTVPTIKGAFVLFGKMRQCCDRGCSGDRKRTHKKTQASYEKLYTGPEFIIDFRYSQILTLTYVCFFYSGGMPFLYVTSFLQLILTYYFDKFFLLRVSKLPKNYDEKLEVTIRTMFYGIVVIHLCITMFMYGQPNIFPQTSSSLSEVTSTVSSISGSISSNNDNAVIKFFKRTQFDYNLILFIALMIILAIYIIKGLLINFIKDYVLAVFQKSDNVVKRNAAIVPIGRGPLGGQNGQDLTLFNVIHSDDIATLIKLTKVSVKTTKNEALLALLRGKIEMLKVEYAMKHAEEQKGAVNPNINFIGFYSYDIRLNPRYKAQFAIEEMLDEEDLN